MRISCLVVLVTISIVAPSWARAQHEQNAIFIELTKQGVRIDKQTVKLPQPTMPDGLDAQGQLKAINNIPGRAHAVEELLERSVTAPYELKIGVNAGQGDARTADMWFVAYGDLETVRNTDFLKRQVQEEQGAKPKAAQEKAKVVTLTEEDLNKRNIRLTAPPDHREQYAHAVFSLLERVRVSGTAHALRTNTKESAMMALVLDDRFLNDPEFPNQWQSMAVNELGRAVLGPPQSYSGTGAYVKATKLVQPADAIFVEYHIVWNEPRGWFNGTTLLTSKLPQLANDGVRKFRRNLENEKKKQAAR